MTAAERAIGAEQPGIVRCKAVIVVPADVAAYGKRVAERLKDVLGGEFVGVYFLGSIALGGYVSGESDVDIAAVTERAVLDALKPRLANLLLDQALGCPARGLEFTLYRRDVVASPPKGADFEVNVNGGPRMVRSVNLDEREQPPFWWVLDRAVAHRFGVAIEGPPAHEVFFAVERERILGAMAESMRWHRTHEGATLYSVLNACRAWRFAVDDVLGSKLEGAAWARSRWQQPSLIDSAVELRHGREAGLDGGQVDEFLAFVEGVLVGSR